MGQPADFVSFVIFQSRSDSTRPPPLKKARYCNDDDSDDDLVILPKFTTLEQGNHIVKLAYQREKSAKTKLKKMRKRKREEAAEVRTDTPICGGCSEETSSLIVVKTLCKLRNFLCISCFGKRVEIRADFEHFVSTYYDFTIQPNRH